VVALALAVGAAPARADHPARVGVLIALEINLRPGEARALSTAIGEALVARLAIDLIAGDDALRRLPPGGVPDACVSEPACLADLGARLAADQLLLFAAVRVGDRLQLDPTWVEVSSGRAVPRPSLEIGAALGADARRALGEAAARLLPDAPVRPTALPAAAPAAALVVPAAGATSSPRGRHMTRGAWIAAGVGGAALVGGATLGVLALRKQGALEDDGCGTTRACDDGADGVARRALIADVLLVGAAAAGATVGWLYWRSDRGEVVVAPTADGAIASLAGAF
jgi:hypothetical protein